MADSESYETVLGKYKCGTNALLKDYNYYSKKGFYNNTFSLDFSELYLYMFNDPGIRKDSMFINYIFSENIDRDFKFTLLPPAIIELKRHYDHLQNFDEIYGHVCTRFNKFSETDDFEKLMECYRIYNGSDDKGKTRIWPELEKRYINSYNQFKDFNVIALMGTEYGSTNILANSHKRLVTLIESKIVVPPSDIEVLSNIVDKIGHNVSVYKTVFEYLKIKRPGKKFANIIDAEHAAMSYHINKKLEKNNFINIYTGSKYPYEIYEKRLYMKKSKTVFFLARCPIYITLRTYCNDQFKKQLGLFDKNDFLSGFMCLLEDLENKVNCGEPINRERVIGDAESERVINELNSIRLFVNDPLKSFLEQSFYLPSKIEMTKAAIEDMKKLDMIKNEKDFGDVESRIAESLKELNSVSSDLYKIYYDYMENINPQKLSKKLKKEYQKLC